MTDMQTPPDWVLIEAAKRCGATTTLSREDFLRWYTGATFRALCDMIQKYEQPPVDRKLLCAREAMAETCTLPECSRDYRNGTWDYTGSVKRCLRAIELWEEGFGK